MEGYYLYLLYVQAKNAKFGELPVGELKQCIILLYFLTPLLLLAGFLIHELPACPAPESSRGRKG